MVARPRGDKKPYELSTRKLNATIPNPLLDAVEEDMEKNGQQNMSKKLAEIIQFWIDNKDDSRCDPVDDISVLDEKLKKLKEYQNHSL